MTVQSNSWSRCVKETPTKWFTWEKVQSFVWDTLNNVNCNFGNVFYLNLKYGTIKSIFRPDRWSRARTKGCLKPTSWLQLNERGYSVAYRIPKILLNTYQYNQTNFMGVFWRPEWPYLWNEKFTQRKPFILLAHSVMWNTTSNRERRKITTLNSISSLQRIF